MPKSSKLALASPARTRKYRFLSIVALLTAIPCCYPIHAQTKVTDSNSAAPTLPPLPGGKATVIGGRVDRLDPVRDQFFLRVYGGKPLKVLFDARTQLYRDGVRAPLRSLRPEERASVETTLDGTDVFALRIHLLSQSPAGECRGQVMRADAAAGVLEVRCDQTGEPVLFTVPAGTPVAFAKPGTAPGLAGITPGTLATVTFSPGEKGSVRAAKVDVLAVPGQVFTFAGTIASLDVRAGRLVIGQAADGATYPIAFDPARFAESAQLREGARATITAGFDGKGYTASAIRLD